jgi:hypothetical protein
MGQATIAIDPYPFDVDELRVQLCGRRTKVTQFENRDAFVKAYFQAPLELLEWALVDGAKVDRSEKSRSLTAATAT